MMTLDTFLVLTFVLGFGTKRTITLTDNDLEVYMNAKELIVHNGYPVEIHNITTIDGFILETQRIRNGKRKNVKIPGRPVVILQHGLMSGSDCFVMDDNASLAFILADAGMDVWLSNSRGNSYSMRHTHYNPKQEVFWAWSFDEMAKYDLPAVIDYILKTSNKSQVYYIGHSQGTSLGLAAFSENKTLADKVKLFVAMAPIAQVRHIKGLLRFTADLMGNRTNEMFSVFGRKSFETNSTFVVDYATKICGRVPSVCASAVSLIDGFDTRQLNTSRVPRYLAHSKEGTSVQNVVHYAQEIRSGLFQKYDYGSHEENMKKYNQTTPPVYDIKNISVPIALYYGGHDWLADAADVTFLQQNLRKIVRTGYFGWYNHLDFVIAMDNPKLLYIDIITILSDTEFKTESRK